MGAAAIAGNAEHRHERDVVLIRLIKRRISAIHQNHKRIAAGAVLIGALTLIAKMFAAVREIAVAWRFGVSGTVDAYQLALTIVTWLPIMLSTVMTAVLVPRLVALQRTPEDYRQFTAELNGTIVLAAAAVTALTLAVAPFASHMMAARENAQTLQLTSTMADGLAPIAFFVFVSGYFSTRLQARERFSYSITEAVPAVIIAVFIIAPIATSAPRALVEGTVIGFLLQVVLLLVLVIRRDAPLGWTRMRHRSHAWRSIYRSMAFMGAGQMLIMASVPIDQGFAARLGQGSVATLGYANRIIGLVTGIGTVVIGRALLPVLAGAVASDAQSLALRHARQWFWLLLGAGSVGSVLLWPLIPEAVRLLFQRGEFDERASAAVGAALRVGLIQVPFYFAGIALVQWYAATSRFAAILLITSTGLAVKMTANALLIPHFGLRGILLASSAMYLWTAALLFIGTQRSRGEAASLPVSPI